MSNRSWLTIPLLLLIVFSMYVRWDVNEPTSRTPDEYYYRQHASVLNERGLVDGARALLEQYHGERWRWEVPPPTRLGYSALTALGQRLLDDTTEQSGSRLSLLFSIASVLCLAAMSFRLGGLPLALVAVALFSTAPLDLAVSRRAWTDGLMVLLPALALLAALELRSESRFSGAWLALLASAGASVVWVKESGPLIIALLLFLAVQPALTRRDLKDAAVPCAWVAGAGAVSFALLAWTVGGLGTLLLVYDHIREAVPLADYARTYQDGPWYTFVLAAWWVTPGLVVLGGFSSLCLGLFAYRPERWPELDRDKLTVAGILLGISALFVVAASVPDYYKNLRYLSPIYVPMYLAAALVLNELVRMVHIRLDDQARMAFAGLLTLGFAAVMYAEYVAFRRMFIVCEAADLNLFMFRLMPESGCM